ncbi:Golgi-associated PDZ and coiled-coil motif-containing protein-like [Panonychus citri]|uniref:Golgi-associated PDZ and coiled-coil motif-containing protein-like n=1 Tax=Panonychus citri TaxID=50023 RepID=UPI002307AC49|nr:Golgi-associated PDZ and coiled-coil motif-containing protein-like [Panonychus citri]
MSSDKSNLITVVGKKWLELLEKEFDKAFVDLDLIIGQFEEDSNDLMFEARQRMATMSSIFAQLVHKTAVVFENNTKLEMDFLSTRDQLINKESEKRLLECKLAEKIAEKSGHMFNLADTYHSKRRDSRSIRAPLSLSNSDNKLKVTSPDEALFPAIHAQQEIKALRKENTFLRRYLISIESELFGARLAAKYLDKELSGRIQQIQLLGKSDIKGQEQDRVWNQLEAEIHLHRHKTVIRHCRGTNSESKLRLNPSKAPPDHEWPLLRKRKGIGDVREVIIERDMTEGLGISITGGKEHGVPILISEIHPDTPASRCGQLYVGDAIVSVNGTDLRSIKHEEAAEILSKERGRCNLQVFFVSTDDEDEDEEDETNKYPYFDPEIVSQIDLDESFVSNQGDGETSGLDQESGGDSDGAISSVTDTFSPSPSKFYPGVAKLCVNDDKENGFNDDNPNYQISSVQEIIKHQHPHPITTTFTNSKKETLIE